MFILYRAKNWIEKKVWYTSSTLWWTRMKNLVKTVTFTLIIWKPKKNNTWIQSYNRPKLAKILPHCDGSYTTKYTNVPCSGKYGEHISAIYLVCPAKKLQRFFRLSVINELMIQNFDLLWTLLLWVIWKMVKSFLDHFAVQKRLHTSVWKMVNGFSWR